MCSGQGSQYYQMGKELFARHPVFREWMLRLDDLVYEMIGERVVDQLYHDKRRKDERFDRTLYTHPAIFMVEYSLARVLQEAGIYPDYVLGTSLGEFVSATLAGVLEVDEALEAVLQQAAVVENHCQKAGMLAILSPSRFYHETPLLHENSELAAVNYDEHFVVSGKNDGLKRAEEFLKEKGVLCQALPVSYGFHSSLIEPAAEECKNFLTAKTLRRPGVPFVSGLFGGTVSEILPHYFWEVVRGPMQFQQAIRSLEEQQDHLYLDLGPSGTMANFAKRNLGNDSLSKSYAVMTPFGQELRNLETITMVIQRNGSSVKG